jgi:hypothetical protein
MSEIDKIRLRKNMKALSIRQPWAWAILHCGKDIENRDWSDRNPGIRFRGEFLIHTGHHPDGKITNDDIADLMRRAIAGGMSISDIPKGDDLPFGGIVGRARVVDVVREHSSPWFFGPIGLVIEDAKPLPFVRWKGALGFFNVPDGYDRA